MHAASASPEETYKKHKEALSIEHLRKIRILVIILSSANPEVGPLPQPPPPPLEQ